MRTIDRGVTGVSPRRRRGLLLMAISALGLAVVFVLVAGYVADVREEVDPKVRLLTLAKPAEAFRRSPTTWSARSRCPRAGHRPRRCATPASSSASRGDAAAQGLAAPGGHAGRAAAARSRPARARDPGRRRDRRRRKIGPDSVVDIVATYPGNDRKAAESRVVVPNARIVEVGRAARRGRPRRARAGRRPVAGRPGDVRAHARAVLVVSYAESNAAEVRLALLRAGATRRSRRSGARTAGSRSRSPAVSHRLLLAIADRDVASSAAALAPEGEESGGRRRSSTRRRR